MEIWRSSDKKTIVPPDHFGGLEVAGVVPFEGRNSSVQISTAPPGRGGDAHRHETWAQALFVMIGSP